MHSWTVNHQPWDGDPTPYVVALVELPEQPGLRLTTNIVGCAPEAVHIGLPVRVVFEHRDPVWFPLFEPRGPTMTDFERRSIISGIGQSAVGRRLGRTGLDLTIEAALAAIADAGLELADIDGLATYPGAGIGGRASPGRARRRCRMRCAWS